MFHPKKNRKGAGPGDKTKCSFNASREDILTLLNIHVNYNIAEFFSHIDVIQWVASVHVKAELPDHPDHLDHQIYMRAKIK